MDSHTTVTGKRMKPPSTAAKTTGSSEHSRSWQANPDQFFFGNLKKTKKRNIADDNIQPLAPNMITTSSHQNQPPSTAATSEPLRKGYSGEFLVRIKEMNLQKMLDDCRREIYGKTLDPVSFENKYQKIVDDYRRQIYKEPSTSKISTFAQSSQSKKDNTHEKIFGNIKEAKMKKIGGQIQGSRHKIEPSKPKSTAAPSWKAKPNQYFFSNVKQTKKQQMVPNSKPPKPKCTTSSKHTEPWQANSDQFFYHNIKQSKKQKIIHQDSQAA